MIFINKAKNLCHLQVCRSIKTGAAHAQFSLHAKETDAPARRRESTVTHVFALKDARTNSNHLPPIIILL